MRRVQASSTVVLRRTARTGSGTPQRGQETASVETWTPHSRHATSATAPPGSSWLSYTTGTVHPPPPPPPEGLDEVVRKSLPEIFDLARGKEGRLPAVDYIVEPARAKALLAWLGQDATRTGTWC